MVARHLLEVERLPAERDPVAKSFRPIAWQIKGITVANRSGKSSPRRVSSASATKRRRRNGWTWRGRLDLWTSEFRAKAKQPPCQASSKCRHLPCNSSCCSRLKPCLSRGRKSNGPTTTPAPVPSPSPSASVELLTEWQHAAQGPAWSPKSRDRRFVIRPQAADSSQELGSKQPSSTWNMCILSIYIYIYIQNAFLYVCTGIDIDI